MNRYLLDTHSLLWFSSGSSQLSDKAKVLIDDEQNQKLVSMGSIWEMGIKMSRGKLVLALPISLYVKHFISEQGFTLLSISLEHIEFVVNLPFHHRDPFDRMLIAQAMVEGIPILSADKAFDSYPMVKRIW